MWGLSAQFLSALKAPHKLAATLTVTAPGGSPLTVPVEAGSISVDGNARIRRTASLTVFGDNTVYDACSTPGALFRLKHGLIMGHTTELIPVLTGELAGNAQQDFGSGAITLSLADLGNWLTRCTFQTPYTPGAITRVAAITAVVLAARPGTGINNTSTDTGLVPAGLTWSTGALDVISDLSIDGGLECFFGPDGVFNIRNQQTLTSQPVWTANSGSYGVIEQAARQRPVDRLYNLVIVQPSASDGSQTWAPQTAAITDPGSPRYYTKIGVVPFVWSSPSITTAAQALAAAQRILAWMQGTDTTLSLQLLTNPGLEANDVIRVGTPSINWQPALTFQHFVDSFTFDLVSGSQQMNTRNQVVIDGT